MAKKFKLSTGWIVLIVVVVVGMYLVGMYNNFVNLRVNVDGKWAQVETQYQRRMDLIPNLQNIVQGAANFEKSTYLEVTKARTQWMSAQTRSQKITAAGNFDAGLSRLLLTFENYPKLKATEAYRDFMAQLEGTENRVAVSRKDFNESVQMFNTNIRRFPANLIAGVLGFDKQTFFKAELGSEKAPTIKFD